MPHEVDIHVGERIRNARCARDMTQQQLAALAGCRHQQVAKYETGANRVSASRLVMIARALDLTPAHFFNGLGFDDKANTGMDLTRAEARLIVNFREMSSKQKASVRKLISSSKG